MNQNQLQRIAPIFLQMKNRTDKAICEEIASRGFSKGDAERISAFLPSAFCRVALGQKFQINFPDTFKVHGSDNEYFYKNEPIFVLAMALAEHIFLHEPELSEVFNTIVLRSAEFIAVNKAANDGAKIKGATLSIVIYFGYETLGTF